MTYSILGNAVVTINTANSDIVGSFGNVSILTRFTGNLLPNTTIYSAQAQLPVGFVISENLFQGTIAGFTSGGFSTATPPGYVTVVQKTNFVNTGGVSAVGNLSTPRGYISGQSSSTHGYNSGGSRGATCYNFGGIDKFPFSVGGTATTTTSLTQARYTTAGHSSSIAGYVSGGYCVFTTNLSRIDKFPFSSDTTISCIGALVTAKAVDGAGLSSSTNGYTLGGNINSGPPPQRVCIIEKFPFAIDSSAISVGCLLCKRVTSGVSSTINGYSVGGASDADRVTFIERFPFASESGAITVGNLNQGRSGMSSFSSTEHGFGAGGYLNPPGASSLIERFSFATDSNATFFNNLICCTYGSSPTQD